MANILIIEDDTLLSRMYQKSFTGAGHTVSVAPNGITGLELARNSAPQLILCDIMMPEMNGLEVLEKLKADPMTASIPIIMLTNLAGTQDAQTAIAKGALKYLIKSEHKPSELVEIINQFFARPASVNPTNSPAPQNTTPPTNQTSPPTPALTATPTTTLTTTQKPAPTPQPPATTADDPLDPTNNPKA